LKEVRKKSADPAVNQMLLQAYRQQVELGFDRADAMQPQCGFARLALCCNDCAAGPCRVSPFAKDAESTICGYSADDLTAEALRKQTAAGARSLLRLAVDFGARLDSSVLQQALNADQMVGLSGLDGQLRELGQAALTALQAINQASNRPTESHQSQTNLGTLIADQANILVFGHVPPEGLRGLAAAATGKRVGLFAMSGNETSGELNLPIVTNYFSQEIPLVTGAVDLLVCGSQCVMPATLQLAKQLGVPIMRANELLGAGQASAVQQALTHFENRSSSAVSIPPISESLTTNYTAENSRVILEKLVAACAAGRASGLVYFGGCGDISNTQDAGLIKLASNLCQQGYLLVTAGCVGTALAKAGLCNSVKFRLPGTDLPAVLHLGACHSAAEFLPMAELVQRAGVPVAAVFSELVQPQMFATALAFAVSGAAVFVDVDWIFESESVADLLQRLLPQTTDGSVRPLFELGVWQEALVPVAVGK
jgi:hydroxylamine reductase (hybrid-cluster protein)